MACRIARLEAATAPKPDLSEVSDEDLQARWVELMQKQIDDPSTTEVERHTAIILRDLPWGAPFRDWTQEQLDTMYAEADRDRWRR